MARAHREKGGRVMDKIRGMPSISAFDAGERQMNASKAFPEGQPAGPQARAVPSVGWLLEGEWRPQVQDPGTCLPNVEGGGRSGALRNSQRDEQRRCRCRKAGLHVRAVC